MSTNISITSSPLQVDHVKENDKLPNVDFKTYHSHLDEVHNKIHRYDNFSELILYLNNTLLTNYPFINYPSDEILLTILLASQLHYIDDKSTNIINYLYPSIQYINSLLNLFTNESLLNNNNSPIFETELNNLYDKISTIFGVLKPKALTKRLKKKSNTFMNNSDYIDSIPDIAIDEEIDTVEDKIKNDKLESLLELSTCSDRFLESTTFFGIKYLTQCETNLWNYFIFAFKTASSLANKTNIQSYAAYEETWNHWREFLHMILDYMTLELKRSKNIFETLFVTNLFFLSGSTQNLNQIQFEDSISQFIKILFIREDSPLSVSRILPTDLSLSSKYEYPCIPFMLESKYIGTKIGLDSISTRSRFFLVFSQYFDLLGKTGLTAHKYESALINELLNLYPKELFSFFPSISTSLPLNENPYFKISFKCIQFICRSFSFTAETWNTSVIDYLDQIQDVFNSFVLISDTSSIQEVCDEPKVFQNSNSNLEKVFILLKYQITHILEHRALTTEEKEKLNSIEFQLDGLVVQLKDIFD